MACLACAQGKSQPKADLASMADRYFDEYYFKYNPTAGTADGFHQYDDQLEDYSRASIDKQIALLKKFKQEFATQFPNIKPGSDVGEWIDLSLLRDDINGHLLSLENIRGW